MNEMLFGKDLPGADLEKLNDDFSIAWSETETVLSLSVPNYKYREGEIMREVLEYIDGTYSEHYVHEQDDIETGQLILANRERGRGFCIGNVIKYADRYGSKDGFNRKDLFKVIHYAVMALSIHPSDSE